MQRLKNPYTQLMHEIKPGDVFAFTITCHVVSDKQLRFYRCAYPADGNSIPQGSAVGGALTLYDIFPTMHEYVMRNQVNDDLYDGDAADDDVTPHRVHIDASTLGFEPGEWPDDIVVNGQQYLRYKFDWRYDDLLGVEYRATGNNELSLFVHND